MHTYWGVNKPMPNDIIHKWRHDHQNLSYLHKINNSQPDLPNSISIFIVFLHPSVLTLPHMTNPFHENNVQGEKSIELVPS